MNRKERDAFTKLTNMVEKLATILEAAAGSLELQIEVGQALRAALGDAVPADLRDLPDVSEVPAGARQIATSARDLVRVSRESIRG